MPPSYSGSAFGSFCKSSLSLTYTSSIESGSGEQDISAR